MEFLYHKSNETSYFLQCEAAAVFNHCSSWVGGQSVTFSPGLAGQNDAAEEGDIQHKARFSC
jgi:hypothetical protein